MDYQKVIVLVVTFLPTLYEAFTDRFGEAKKDKITDGIILVVASVIMTAVAYLVLKNWIAVPLFILLWRGVAFDYTVNFFLKRHSESHRHIEIWHYVGSTTYWWDQLTAKVPWKIRLIVRAVVFTLAVFMFFS